MFSKKYHLFLICLNLVSSFHVRSTSRLSGFVLVDNNFTYVEEIVPTHIDTNERIQETYSPNDNDIISPSKANVRFEPSILYFKDKVVGNSYRETVYLINTSQNKTLKMDKIAGGKYSQFQIASLGNEFVPAGGNTSFDIVFVGKDLVPLTTHYYIFTSKGIIKYDVFSSCVKNPYRISPMASIILPLNSSYSHSVTLRNPFSEPLLITEALLHGGNYASHSLPPTIDFERAIESWTIRPYETKEILRVHFLTFEAWNLTTFQSIKLGTGTTLLIPVEVEVVPRTGLYVPGHKIDFESGGHLDPPAVRPLHLCSSSKKTVNIENVSCESRIDGCEVMDFRPTTLPPWSCAVNPVAKVKFVWNAKIPGEFTSGGLLIKNDLDPYFRVNYTARIHHGGLTYNASSTQYVTSIPAFNAASRPFAFTNEYRDLVAVMNVYLSFEAAEYFHIRGFEPSVLKPQEQRVLFNLQTRKGVRLTDVKLDSSILLETNISTIRLPLRVYDGLLTKLSKVAPSSLHLGLVGTKTTVVTYFGLANPNPETIFVKYFGCNDSSIRIELLDVKPGNARTFYYRSFVQKESRVLHAGGFNMHPHHYASFKLSVNTSETEGEVYAEVWIQSEFQRLAFPFYMNVAKGYVRVSPDPFEFEDCFPGAFCVQQLTVESHFLRSMSIINISTIPYTPYDKLLFYPNVPATIAGHATSIVGNILWEPSIDSSQTWPLGYLGLPNNKTGRDRWLGTIERPNITRDFDLTLMESQYLRYREQFSSSIELMLRMDTTEVKNFLFRGRIQLQWPQIVTTRIIDFPLVQIGTASYENVSIFNPMHSHYLTVQAILACHYQQEVPPVVETMISEFEEPGGVESKSNEFFLDMSVSSPFRYNFLNGSRKKYTNHRSSVVFVLPPQANATISIGFQPTNPLLTSTRLYLRNDFTILDSVVLNGAGAYPQLTLEGLDNAVVHLIKFVIPHETLKLCEETSNKVLNITTKKLFRLRNTGQVSVQVFGFTINGLPCQGYGFKITNCHHTPFILKPGTSKRIEVSFTPDFTSARIESTLQVDSDIRVGPMLSYTLYAALDSDWLRKCKPHLQRPHWEPLVYYLMIGMFFFLLIGVAIMAVYEVSAHTNRLINGFGGVEQKVQPFYDLKLIELFFIRSSFPHHHHHHHHHHSHHRSSSTAMQVKSETTPRNVNDEANTSIEPQFECGADAKSNLANGSAFVPHISENVNRTNNSNSSNCDEIISELIRSPSPVAQSSAADVSESSKIVGVSTNSSSQSAANNEKISITNNISADYRRRGVLDLNTAKNTQPSDNQQSNTMKNNFTTDPLFIEENGYSAKAKKGKKFDLEEACYKSNWFKKKQAKKEEKINGAKFVKNSWPRCLKCGAIKKDIKSPDDKRCNCVEKCNIYTNDTENVRKEVAQNIFAANSSSHSNNSKLNKEIPRKLDYNKCNKKTNASPCEFASETSSTTTETPSVVVEDKESEIAIKVTKLKKKKSVELNLTKQNENTTKESSKENCAYKCHKTATAESKKCVKEEKNNIQSVGKADRSKSPETPPEALKPITNLPKSKEPFETLSSLCSESVNLKSRRKSNVKKRTKEEKFVNLAKELSIVFNTPETTDRKYNSNRNSTKNSNNSNNKKKAEIKPTEPVITANNSKRKFIMNNSSNIVFNDETNYAEEESHNYLMNDINNTSAGSLNNGVLYSRVVAPPASRSSSSSSSSESTTSFDSTGMLSATIVDNRPSNSVFWESWNNDMLCQNGVMPSNSHIFDMPVFNDTEERNETKSRSMFSNYEAPEFIVLGDDSRVAAEPRICRPSHPNGTAEKETTTNTFVFPEEYEINSDETEDMEYFNFPKGNLSDEDDSIFKQPESPRMKPVGNDIWGPPTSLFAWTPSDLSGSPSNLSSDAVSAISLSRLLRFEEKKEKAKEEIEQYRSLSSLWSSDMKSLWSHPKQE